MLSTRFIRSLVWAGLVSNALAIVVCLICRDNADAVSSLVDYAIWVMNYAIHRYILKTW